jgi:hypothetical protein
MSFIIIFLILFYLNIKILVANSRNGRDRGLSNSKPVNYLYISSLPVFSLFILGFLIMEWYIFLILMFVIMFDPLAILLGREHSLSTMVFVINNYIACMLLNLVSTFGLWFYYFYNQ